MAALRAAHDRSRRLLASRGVFDVSAKWNRQRDRYGDTDFGRNCLVARRLVEQGVPFVEVEQQNYDSHSDNFEWHKALLPTLDKGWSGLLRDLDERGLLQNTLVVWMGEFGRTPGINNRAGRDHYARAWSVVLAGGGVRGATEPEVRDIRVLHGHGQTFVTWSDVAAGDEKLSPLSQIVPGKSSTIEPVEEKLAPRQPIKLYDSKSRGIYSAQTSITDRKGLTLRVELHGSQGQGGGAGDYGNYYLLGSGRGLNPCLRVSVV